MISLPTGLTKNRSSRRCSCQWCSLEVVESLQEFVFGGGQQIPDRFDKEQEFTSLQLSVVQSRSLVESLQEFVRGDMLEGHH